MIFTLEYLFLLKWCFYAYILIEEMLKLGYTSCHCKYYSEQGPIFKLCEYLVLKISCKMSYNIMETVF